MDKKLLQNIGLTEGEVKVYMALLKLGESKKSELSKESGISSSKIYEVADKLQKKGLIGYISKDNIKYFRAMEPKRILDFFNEKTSQFHEQKKALEKFIPELESVSKKEETNAILFEGIKAIKNFYKNLLEELKPGEEYYVIGVNYGDNLPGVREFFENFHNQRAKKKIKVKMLVNHDSRNILVKSTQTYSEVRFLPQYLMNNMIILFYKNKAFIFFLAKDSVGLLIENKEVTKGFKVYFDAFWKIAKP
ncbi:MAG: helix-turn-helix domain-containing protein [Candidatus Pacearchaeota archaeon]|jgi:sugar-specific transcriptional regulator TrmB